MSGQSSERLIADSRATPIRGRDLQAARDAYEERDVSMTIRAHAGVANRDDLAVYFEGHDEPHLEAGEGFVKAMVFGGLDGVVTIFAIIAGCVGAAVTPRQFIVVGLGNLLADAFSMGIGEYVSCKAEIEFVKAETDRESWEIENHPEGEVGEMIELYQSKYGFSKEDAEAMAVIGFKYPKYFLQHMMVEELGLQIGFENASSPAAKGLVMFASFAFFGLIPLLGFIVFLELIDSCSVQAAFAFTCLVTLSTVFVLGVFKARFANQNPIKSGLTMTLIGAVASSAAYFSGVFLQDVVGHLG